MTKKMFLTAVVALGLWATQINAQSTSFGVKIDANMSNFALFDVNNLKSTMKVGASIGGFLKIDFSEYFAIQPELSILYKSSEMKVSSIKSDYNYWGFEVPVYAMVQLTHEEGNRAYLGIGPVFDCGFSAKSGGTKLYKDNAGALQQERFNVGAGVLLGYEFDFGMQINASYKYGLLNSLKNPVGDAYSSPQSVSLGIGYRF
ncbi:MAG: porin family protein [Paludibacter sp.]|jgi:hypothetical protein|nr:porin family protein [Paludibacter sp.]